MALHTQKALLLTPLRNPLSSRPSILNEILVNVQANSVEWKVQKYAIAVNHNPAVISIDPASGVEELGKGLMGVPVGDRV